MPTDCLPSIDPQDAFSRTVDFLGEEGWNALRDSFVIVIGLGGVGSHTAVALIRAGLGRIRLVDFDKVAASNLNRHAVAARADVGRPKTEVLGRYLRAISPEAEIEQMEAFFHLDTAERILAGSPTYVVDAIDGLNTKVALLRTCVEKQLPVVSAMGASLRSDPTLIRVDDISRSQGCPLARHVRRRLGRQGIREGILTVFSTDKGRAPLPPDENEEIVRGGRVRNRLPSLSTLPGIIGYAVANAVILRVGACGGRD